MNTNALVDRHGNGSIRFSLMFIGLIAMMVWLAVCLPYEVVTTDGECVEEIHTNLMGQETEWPCGTTGPLGQGPAQVMEVDPD